MDNRAIETLHMLKGLHLRIHRVRLDMQGDHKSSITARLFRAEKEIQKAAVQLNAGHGRDTPTEPNSGLQSESEGL